MKNKFVKILAVVLALGLTVSVSACNNDGGNTEPAHTHEYSALKSNATSHWYECSCGAKVDLEEHKGGTLTCTAQAECEVCDTLYGKLDHSYTILKSDANKHWYECSCGAKSDEKLHSIGGTQFTAGNQYEYSTALAELFESNKLKWLNGKPEDASKYAEAGFFCETCGCAVKISVSGEHNLDGITGYQVTKPTCETDGEIYEICADCGKKIVVKVLEKLGHSYNYEVIGATEELPGVAKGTCTRAGCNHTVEVKGSCAEYVARTCGTDGKHIYKYVDEKTGFEVVARKHFFLERTGNHIDPATAVKVEFNEDGYKYECYFCTQCKNYVIISKVAIN